MTQRPKKVQIRAVYRCNHCVDKSGKQTELTSEHLESHLFNTKK